MKIYKKITMFHNEPISVTYRSKEFQNGDTPLTIYDRYRISILLTDGMSAVMGDKIVAARTGSILFFRPEELHFGRVYRSGVHEYLDIFLPLSLWEQPLFREVVDFLTDTSEDRINGIVFEGEKQQQVETIAREMVDTLLTDDGKSEVRLFSMILRIILLCSDSYGEAKLHPAALEIPPFVKNTLHYISENFTKSLSLEMLASRERCSAVYLSRVFKAHTGMTIYHYITNLRIAYARRLLNEGASVTEACFASGFNDCSNFIGKFKRITGKTPKQFQNQKKES